MSQRLLLADDSLTIQRVVDLVLAHDNFEIRACGDGEQAMEAMKSFDPDIVLADIEMPKVDGYRLCEEIKRNEATSHIPVILLAGAFEPFDEEQARSVGADDFLIKPFDGEDLIRKVKGLLSPEESPKEVPGAEEEVREPAPVAVIGEGVAAAEEESRERWQEEVTVSTVSGGVADKSYETPPEVSREVAGEKLKEALELPKVEEVSRLLSGILKDKVDELLDRSVLPDLSSVITGQVQTTVSQAAPAIIEKVSREVIGDLVASLRSDIEVQIKRIIPEIAERIIQQEIERITKEF